MPDRTPHPLVSIGVPVRNGGRLLTEALQQLVDQTYPNLEIIISDNNSSDETPALCQAFAAQDSRIIYRRQSLNLSAIENFKFVLDQARGDYFMWAAHDDRRDLNYIATLVQSAQATPGCALVFADAVDFSDHDDPVLRPLDYAFASDTQTPFFKKIRRLLYRNVHFYGLYPRKIWDGVNWQNHDFGWDQIALAYISTRGDFIKARGTYFYCYRPSDRYTKSPKQRALNIAKTRMKPLPELRRAWNIVNAACYGEKLNGKHHSRIGNFLRLYLFYVLWPSAKQTFVNICPEFILKQWREIRTFCLTLVTKHISKDM